MIIKNHKHENNLTIKAIELKDLDNACQITKKPKKAYQWFNREKAILFVVDKNNLDLARLYSNLKEAVKTMKKNINVDVDSFLTIFNQKELHSVLILNVVLATSFYSEPPFSMKTSDILKYNVNFLIDDSLNKEFEEAINIRDSQIFCRKLQDTPSNILNATTFVDEVSKFLKELKKIKISILDKKELKKKGMNLILAVNAGSEEEAKLIVIEYKNNPNSKECFGYVGKGITFDAGGLNIKTSNFMRNMKFDMSGAATVCSVMYALAKNDVKTNVIAIAPLTDNLINSKAFKPDDIITSYSGKTIEIDNTDAEGRLVLADALAYASKDLKVSKLIDIATLTGAMMYSLGDTFTGVWATNDDDWNKFNQIAKKAGDYVWRLPFHEDFLKPLASKVADFSNSSNDHRAGSSRAACFLKEFTNDVNYIHLDVAITTDVDGIGHAAMLKSLYLFAKEQ